MHLILGGTGNVGGAVAGALLDRGEPVTVLTRDAARAESLRKRGAAVAVVDVLDTGGLRRIFATGTRLFLLNPPAAPATDTVAEERGTLASILAATEGSGLRKIVAGSTYGARPGEAIGDLGVLYGMEQALAAQSIPATLIRGAYYMTNWRAALATAREEGLVHSFYPEDFRLPMVDPADIGGIAAGLLVEPLGKTGLHLVEGPARYSPGEVADAFAKALGIPVKVRCIPEAEWVDTLREAGYSREAAESFARMTAATLDGDFPGMDEIERGSTTLEEFVRRMVILDG